MKDAAVAIAAAAALGQAVAVREADFPTQRSDPGRHASDGNERASSLNGSKYRSSIWGTSVPE